MKLQALGGVSQYNAGTISLRCPHCRHEGAFARTIDINDIGWVATVINAQGNKAGGQVWAGTRVCPNPECRGVVSIHNHPALGRRTYPPETIDFDATALPERILSSLEEAVSCHAAGAYRATALMVRRILEELCEDRQATGKNLKDRLGNVGSNIIVPKELLDAADELRLLGNDAAHIEAKSYDDIGEAEASLAIELAKELLKAVYQYQSLVDRLRGLKKQ